MRVERKTGAQRFPYPIILACLFTLAAFAPGVVWAQDATPQVELPGEEEQQAAPDQVNVQPLAQDEEIAARLTRILQATGWFVNPDVTVRDGVVFLDGQTRTQEHRDWAGNLARNTQDVVAVVNRLEVIPRPLWDFTPARTTLMLLWRSAVQAIPLLIFAAIVLLLSWYLTKFIAGFLRRFFEPRVGSPLLAIITARVVAVPIFLLGVYLVLQVSGLTRLALTVLGGTGIVGIVVGFAFRDIAENFLASILLSIRQPFRRDDLIQVGEQMGVVQQLNTRATILMTFEGNHVQIPNATIFKSVITNYTANPNRRIDFIIGIGYDDSTQQAQEIIAHVLDAHPSVLKSPEPLVLVEELATATVNLHVFLWYDGTQYGPLKLKSSLLRQIKHALQEAGISMPDEAREVIFPKGVPLLHVSDPADTEQVAAAAGSQPEETPQAEPVTLAAEGDLRSDEQEIREQAKQSRVPEEGADLLDGS